ncbi:hypothetical protein HanRHA438_Chr03g0144061 [Helianthus annuus]|nr:hypothetical protein HanRHA438_Chr03g0144061 [Helianthus annuus]
MFSKNFILTIRVFLFRSNANLKLIIFLHPIRFCSTTKSKLLQCFTSFVFHCWYREIENPFGKKLLEGRYVLLKLRAVEHAFEAVKFENRCILQSLI